MHGGVKAIPVALDDHRLDPQEIFALARLRSQDVVAGPAKVAILGGHQRQVMKRRDGSEADEKLPVLEELEFGVEGTGLVEEGAFDHQGVEGNVVVDEQQLGIEVPAVGQAAIHLLPAGARLELVDPDRGVGVGDPHPGGRHQPDQRLEVLGFHEIVVVEEAQIVAGGGVDTRVGGSGATLVDAHLDPDDGERERGRDIRDIAPVVDQDDLDPSDRSLPAMLSRASASSSGRSLVRTMTLTEGPSCTSTQVGNPSESANQSAVAVGDQVDGADLAVRLGGGHLGRQRQGAKVAHPESRLSVVVQLELARVRVDGRGQDLESGG